MDFASIRALDAEHVMQTYGRLPVAFVRGEGTRLWDSEGNEYLDFLGGLAALGVRVATSGAAERQGIQEDLFPLKGSRLQWQFHEPNQYLVIETAGGMGEIPPVFSAQLRRHNDQLLVVLEETPFILTARRL